VIIVGAGVSGLACAQALREAGRQVLLLERARGVGGRCATRRLGDQTIDFGPSFLHGRDPGFLAALRAVPATRLPGWPAVVEGLGQPCQPEAFIPGEERLAFAEGVVAFPKSLTRGLDVLLEQDITRLEQAGHELLLETAAGEEHQAPIVVLALAAEQSRRLLLTMGTPAPSVRGAAALLGLSHSQACLTLMALYPEEVPRPRWQVCFPQESKVLQLVSHDSSKRPPGARVALVLQARPAWSRAHLEDPAWAAALLEEAGEVVGPWAAKPSTQAAHRWTWARDDRSAELAAPMLLELPGGARLGLCGDRFAPGGGVEAAWCSGRALAARIILATKEQS
jgi:predicted NAD/FAD-dependent oxidoreductase